MNDDSIPTWITRDGQHIPVNQMTDSHLNNAIAHLDKSVIKNKEYWINYCRLKIEADRRLWQDIADDDLLLGRSYMCAYEYPTEDTEVIKKYQKLILLIEGGDPRGIDIYSDLIRERESRKRKTGARVGGGKFPPPISR